MARGRAKERKIRPTFYVFCEGESEKEYVNFLRAKYRMPIEIKSKITGHTITKRFIEKHLEQRPKHDKDKTFLMYDLDEEGLLAKLKLIPNSILLVSNPCIEFWFLLHLRNQRANISCDICNKELKSKITGYEKGKLNLSLTKTLSENYKDAISKAKELSEFSNPSSAIYKFIEEIEAQL